MSSNLEALYGRTDPKKYNIDVVPDMARSELSGKLNYTNGRPNIYCDHTATTPMLERVQRTVAEFNTTEKANVHRGVYELSQKASDRYDRAHEKVADLFGADPRGEILFVGQNATAALNQIVHSLFKYDKGHGNGSGRGNIVLSKINHSSNVMPLMDEAQRHGYELRWVGITPSYGTDLDQAERLIDDNTKVVAVTHVSNVTGAIDDIRTINRMAHEKGSLVIVDGVQAAPHLPVNVKELDCDVWFASAHKMFGPNVGIAYGRKNLLKRMSPADIGGGTPMHIESDGYFLAPVPDRFEAGTPDIGNAIGLGALTDFLVEMGQRIAGDYKGRLAESRADRRKYMKIAMEGVREHEMALSEQMIRGLESIPGLKLYGSRNPKDRVPTFSINIGEMHSDQLAMLLDGKYEGKIIPVRYRIQGRSGCHCAYPLLKEITGENIRGTARLSLGMDTTKDDVEKILDNVNFVAKNYGSMKRDDSKSRKLAALKSDFEQRATELFLSPKLNPQLYREILSLQDEVLTDKYNVNVRPIIGGGKLPDVNGRKFSDRKMRKMLSESAIGFAEHVSNGSGFRGFKEALLEYNRENDLSSYEKPWCYKTVERHFRRDKGKDGSVRHPKFAEKIAGWFF